MITPPPSMLVGLWAHCRKSAQEGRVLRASLPTRVLFHHHHDPPQTKTNQCEPPHPPGCSSHFMRLARRSALGARHVYLIHQIPIRAQRSMALRTTTMHATLTIPPLPAHDIPCRRCCHSPLCDSDETVDGGDQRAVRLKQGYTLDNSKWPYLPQGEDIMSEFVQLSDILDSPGESCGAVFSLP